MEYLNKIFKSLESKMLQMNTTAKKMAFFMLGIGISHLSHGVCTDAGYLHASSNQTFCDSGNPITFTSAQGGTGSGSYQWQKLSGPIWVNISGATSETYNPLQLI